MKTQIFTLALLLASLSFTSCKNNEAKTTVTTKPTTQVDSTAQVKDTTAKTAEKTEKEENEKNERD